MQYTINATSAGLCDELTACDEHITQWRGGTNGLVRGDRVIGFGHRTHLTDYRHEPFLWHFPLELLDADPVDAANRTVFVTKTVVDTWPGSIRGPSALVA